MIKTGKRLARQLLTFLRKRNSQNIDGLYRETGHNTLMAELESKGDFNKYSLYTQNRKQFEHVILQNVKKQYVALHGIKYHLNSLFNKFSFREGAIDNTGLNARMRFCLAIIRKYFSSAEHVYLTEANTNFHRSLSHIYNQPGRLVTSIYKPGDEQHQDLTALSFKDASFDLCLSFEDLEHIPDYKKAIAELFRVTATGGHILLSTPFIIDNDETIIRAEINEQGEVIHLLEPEYHGDPVLPQGILCFYHFGWDLLQDFKDAGFTSVKIITGFDIPDLVLGEQLFIMAGK